MDLREDGAFRLPGAVTARCATKLILVEGLPGAGKSTLAHALFRQLALHGVAVRWWFGILLTAVRRKEVARCQRTPWRNALLCSSGKC